MTAEALPTGRPAQSSLTADVLGLAAIGLMLACLLLGGATRENARLVAILDLMALPLALASAWRLAGSHGVRSVLAPLVLVAVIVLLPLIQLIPLPFELWAGLPGRAALAEALQRAGAAPAALPMSVTPDLTLRSAMALIPPVAVFLASLQMSVGARRRAIEMVLVVVLVSIVLGLLQVATGADSPLRPYADTNLTSAVGFFANRNHQAALLVIAIPLAAAWAVDQGDKHVRWLAVALAVLAVAGIGAARSRAGILLTAPALLGAVMLILMGAGRHRRGRRQLGIAFGAVALAGALLTAVMAGGGIVERFEDRAESDIRLDALPDVLALADTYAPLGSGIGAFEPAYRVVERTETVGPTFLNHAHNDYAELWVEAGIAGAVTVLAFLIWALVAAIGIWRGPARGGAPAYNRAATLVVALLAVHSFVDYPLRTLALAGVFAFACGLLAAPTPLTRVRR